MNMKGYKSMRDRTEYQAKYYQEHKEQIKARYNTQTQMVKWREVKAVMSRLKRRIGADSYTLIMDNLASLEREKH